MTAMTTATAKPRPLRLNQRAQLVPTGRYAEWHQHASATAGLSGIELAVLSSVVEYYRLLDQRGYASSPSIEQMALSSGARPIDISGAIKRLVGLALLAVRPGSGRWRNEYLTCLPKKRVAASMSAAAAEDMPPF